MGFFFSCNWPDWVKANLLLYLTGSMSHAGAWNCSACLDGTFSRLGEGSCTPCNAGTFSSAASGRVSCTSCDSLGTGYTSSLGASSCDLCLAGFYRDPTSDLCVKCSLKSMNANCQSESGQLLPAPAEGYWVDTTSLDAFSDAKFAVYPCLRLTCTGSLSSQPCWSPENVTGLCVRTTPHLTS